MKKLLLILAVIMMTTGIAAQVPQGITHQAVMRDSQNQPIAETAIGVRISILQGSADGVAVYVETHTPVSNANGLITYVIGQGSVVSGMFSGIDWSDGPYFLKTEADPEGGTNYSITGVTQFLSVPFALHAQTAETLSDEMVETDPVFMDSPAAEITEANLLDWDEAHSWGDHSLADYLTEESDPLFLESPASGILADDIENWDAAFDWGDHGEEGYLKSETDPLFTAWDKSEGITITESQITDFGDYVETETDPLFTAWDRSEGIVVTENQISDLQEYLLEETDPLFAASPASGILSGDIENWDAAFDWGDHGEEGYLKSETDPLFTAWDKSEGITISESQIIDLQAYLLEETDPLFAASPASGILSGDIENWDAAFDWGDHGEEGYLKTETDPLFTAWDRSEGITITESQIIDLQEYLLEETDPLFTASPASGILSGDIENWDTAFDWGDHGEEGYLKSETDPYFTANFDLSGAAEGDLLRYNGSTWVKFTPDYMPTITGYSDEFSSGAGQTVFELSHIPHVSSNVKLFINGVRISNAAYSLNGSTVTYHPENNGSYDLTVGDRIQFDYFY
ncbi:MAG: hypothetical protein RG741_10260 [Bacteroidales bacterium]|nr:hypothetical protein [Bacteroidales bacterium]